MDDKKLKDIIRRALLRENDTTVSPDELAWNDFFELLGMYKIKFEPLMAEKLKRLYFPPKRKEKIKQKNENAVDTNKANSFEQWVKNVVEAAVNGIITSDEATHDILGYAQELYQDTTHLKKMPNMNENIPLAIGPDSTLNDEFTSKLNGLIEEYLRKGIEVKYVRGALNNAMNSVEGKAVSMVQAGLSEEAQSIDEERITNDEGKEFAKRKENFIGSHCWGESLGDGSYVVMSYGKQFPLYVFWNKKNKWYENADHYIFNGEPQESTEEHRRDLRPTDETRKKPADWMRKLSAHLLKVNGIKDYEHISVEPGTKN